jgi:selenocysteine lyase/cysteine desulfurase
MISFNPKTLYQRFLDGHKGKLHFAAHSHHFWPDVTRQAQLAYWDDCAHLSDEKWDKVFGEVIPQTQKYIAKILDLKDHEQIALAPNTHELSARLLSLFLGRSELKILTTSSEFHSWRRQFLRLSELSQIKVQEVSTQNLLAQRSEFLTEIKNHLTQNFDLIFLSQVFFDSGIALTDEELKDLMTHAPAKTLFVVDGYHGFGALPTSLSAFEGRIFYLGGGYKYAQAGEGVGFMVVPQGDWRPSYTGWFAEYGNLSRPAGGQVGYTQNAMAFMGATQDPSGFYRFNATWKLFDELSLDMNLIHLYVRELQLHFLAHLPKSFLDQWKLTPLYHQDLSYHGHFLTFEALDTQAAIKLQGKLKEASILIDRRGSRLRFGFGLYQDKSDVMELCLCLKKLA